MSEAIDVTELKKKFAAFPKEYQDRLTLRWRTELAQHRSRMKAAKELGNEKAYEQLEKAAATIEEMLK